MPNWQARLLGGGQPHGLPPYQSFGPHLAADAQALSAIFADLGNLEAQYDRAFETFGATERGYFTPDEDDALRGMFLSYRSYREAIFSTVYRYVRYAEEPNPAIRFKGFVLGYAAALMMFSKSLRLIAGCGDSPLIRKKLNEADERFGLPAAAFDALVGTYCSLRYLMLFAMADRFWRAHRGQANALGLEAEFAEFLGQIRRLRVACWRQFWPAVGKRLRHEGYRSWRLLFAPARATSWFAQSLLGTALARLRTPWESEPALGDEIFEALAPQLQPGDLLFMRSETKATSAVLPGFFGHVAVYLGRPEDVEAVPGIDHAAAQAALAAMCRQPAPFGWVLEAKYSGVIVQPLEVAAACDHLLALRPQQSMVELQTRLGSALSHYGKPYDFDFDFARTSHVVCTELVYRPLHRQGPFEFTLTKRFGRFTLSVDDIVAQFLADETRIPGAWKPVFFWSQWRKREAFPVDPAALPVVLRRLLPA